MEQDELFLAITDLIGEVPSVAWIDMDFGQMDSEGRPAVGFPCALVSIDYPQITEIGQGVQKPNVLINVKLCFSYTGATNLKASSPVRERALAYYAIVKDVYKKLQGKRVGTGPLRRISQLESARPDQIKIVDISFATSFLDQSARQSG